MTNDNVPSTSQIVQSPAITLSNTPALAAPGSFSRSVPDQPHGDGDIAPVPETQRLAPDINAMFSGTKDPSARDKHKSRGKGKEKVATRDLSPPRVSSSFPMKKSIDCCVKKAIDSLELQLLKIPDIRLRKAIALQLSCELRVAGGKIGSPPSSPPDKRPPSDDGVIDVDDNVDTDDDSDLPDEIPDRIDALDADPFMIPAPVTHLAPVFPSQKSADCHMSLVSPQTHRHTSRPPSPIDLVYDLPVMHTSRFSGNLPVLSFYNNNFVDRRYIPMSAFCEDALHLMDENPSKYIRLDIPKEEDLSPVMWTCATQRWLSWLELPIVSGMGKLHSDLLDCMRLHFRLVKSQPRFSKEAFAQNTWPSVIRHDISFCRCFFSLPWIITEDEWDFQLHKQIMRDISEVNCQLHATQFHGPEAPLAPRPVTPIQFQPYPRDCSFRNPSTCSSDAERSKCTSKKRCFGCGRHGNDIKHACCLCGSFGHAAFDWVCNAADHT
ncbi:hypothetical protein K488DRAFT_91914 [Vararia minispora EC-137]|uniref:Uncharacterized protein n=1 Tax=Vararia minispora EC-137 TaxID=1314806 RepID=A0ACB8Q569_9AGAM|nr:hypothetical protein K488DRAFT_91914 [Vararia minispora EC-137]